MATVNEEGFTAEELVQACNKVLLFAGLIARVSNVEEVRVVCSSTGVFVAALEGFLRHRLDDILRNPTSPAEQAYNNTRVVEVLSLLLSCDLSHISGARIVEGNLEDISNTLELLSALCQGKPLLDPPAPQPSPAPQLTAAGEQERKAAEEEGEQHRQSGSAEEAGASGSSEEHDEEAAERYEEDFEEGSEDEEADEEHRGAADEDPDEQDDNGLQEQGHDHALLQQAYEQQRQHQQQHGRSSTNAASTSAAEGPEVPRRGKASRRARAMQRLGGRRPPLSPILEVSREGWEHAFNGHGDGEGEEVLQPASRAGSRARSRASSVRAELAAAVASTTATGAPAAGVPSGVRRTGSSRGSGGGASSVISIPSVHGIGAPGAAGIMDSPLQPARSEPGLHRQGTQGDRYAMQAGRPPSAAVGSAPFYDQHPGQHPELEAEDTATLLERAVAQAERTLQDLGYAYEDFYYSDDQDDLGDRMARSRSTTSSGLSGGGGRVPKGLLRAARQGPAELALVSAIGPKQHAGKKAAAAGGSSTKAMAGGASTTARGTSRREDAFVELPGSVLPPAPAKHGRQLLQRTAASYEAVLPAPVLLAGRRELLQRPGGTGGGRQARDDLDSGDLDDSYFDDESVDVDDLLRARRRYGAQQQALQQDGSVRPGMHLNADLASRLKYLYDLATENPKQQAARAAVQQVAVRDELEYEKRVEQLRLQRLAAEWHDKQRSAAMRRALAAELELREAFMEVLGQEKERLLVERRDTGRGAAFPHYKKAMRKAEDQYLALYHTLENLLASERQQRLRAARETMAAQQESNALAAEMVHDRVAELLARVSAEEEAILARHSVGSRPEKKAELVGQIRRLLGLT
eukprot:XP_001702389.1 predicted protein [Chlamydomonas reinhardtii]